MARTDLMTQFAGHFQSFVAELARRLGRADITIPEALEALANPRSGLALDQIAEIMIGVVKKPVLKNLELVADNISLETVSFRSVFG